MANPNSNHAFHNVLEEQKRRIEEEKMSCRMEYGDDIFNTTLKPFYDIVQGRCIVLYVL